MAIDLFDMGPPVVSKEQQRDFLYECLTQANEDAKETIEILREENKKLKTELELANERIRELQT